MSEREHGRGRWYVEKAMGGAGVILEQGAGAGGGEGYIAHVEMYEDAVAIVRWWNGREVDDCCWIDDPCEEHSVIG